MNNKFFVSPNKLWPFIFLFTLISCGGRENTSNNLSRSNKKSLNNFTNIKYYKTYRISLQEKTEYFDPISEGMIKGQEYVKVYYDLNNKVLREEQYDQNGYLKRYTKSIYKNGKKHSEEEYTNDHSLSFIRYFNDLGNIVKKEEYSIEGLRENIVYSIDPKGNIEKEEHFSPHQKILYFRVFEYKKNNTVLIHFYDPKGNLISTHKTLNVISNSNNPSEKIYKNNDQN
ncbi:MAG: hypothetical protein OEV44_10520 [Spirochaetota bacterium]|nr:hypothetical protein [Spirochaetota bacterium]